MWSFRLEVRDKSVVVTRRGRPLWYVGTVGGDHLGDLRQLELVLLAQLDTVKALRAQVGVAHKVVGQQKQDRPIRLCGTIRDRVGGGRVLHSSGVQTLFYTTFTCMFFYLWFVRDVEGERALLHFPLVV